MDLNKYYEKYWSKRRKGDTKAIPDYVPQLLRKYTIYGAIRSQIPEGSRILDLGCGDGNVSVEYLTRGEVTGIDISKTALKIAGSRGIKTIYHDLNSIPYPIKSHYYDVIILTDVLEHLIDPVGLLNYLKSTVQKGGRLIITVPNFARLDNRIRMLAGDPVDLLHFTKYGDDIEHLHWFTYPKLMHIFRSLGLRNTEFVPSGLRSGSFIWGIIKRYNLQSFLTAAIIIK